MKRYALLFAMLGACARSAKPTNSDSAFAAVQARGAAVMGVDQYSSAHVFEDLPDGGRIILERKDVSDSAGVATIRAHMRSIADAFAKMDVSKLPDSGSLETAWEWMSRTKRYAGGAWSLHDQRVREGLQPVTSQRCLTCE